MRGKNYRAHFIPKSTPGKYRVVHEFDDVAVHRDSLESLRREVANLPGTNSLSKVSLTTCAHGYPFGNPSMINLVSDFVEYDSNPVERVITSFDLRNFFHAIDISRVAAIGIPRIAGFSNHAFVDVGNGIKVLSQGSPLSQDISNVSLVRIDLKILKLFKTINDNMRINKGVIYDRQGLRTSDHKDTDGNIVSIDSVPIILNGSRGVSSVIRALFGKNSASASAETIVLEEMFASAGTPGISRVVKLKYMRYVDNIYIRFDFFGNEDRLLAKKFARIITDRVKGIFMSNGLPSNRDKDGIYFKTKNRRMPILGLNSTSRLKCTKHYIDKIRAALNNWVHNAESDISLSVMSSVVYIIQADRGSYLRLKKGLDGVRSAVSKNPNFGYASALINFVDRKINA